MKRFVRVLLLGCCAALLLSAGWCERYEQKNARRDNMKRHYDSVLRQEHLQKDSIWQAQRKEWERKHNPQQ